MSQRKEQQGAISIPACNDRLMTAVWHSGISPAANPSKGRLPFEGTVAKGVVPSKGNRPFERVSVEAVAHLTRHGLYRVRSDSALTAAPAAPILRALQTRWEDNDCLPDSGGSVKFK